MARTHSLRLLLQDFYGLWLRANLDCLYKNSGAILRSASRMLRLALPQPRYQIRNSGLEPEI
ncbi:hypothetical protein CU048_08115 [Beijerinckiaceae bacterium]|nr:hypothetical protein CU048_08115 [Beijerinckiaceae bacterium]